MRQVTSAPQEFTPLRGLSGALKVAPIVMLAALVAGLVESADLTLLPLFGMHSGLDERAALLLVAVFMAGNVVLQVPIGLLADRYGRRRLLGFCAVTSCVGPLLLQRCLDTPLLLWPLLFMWGGTLYAFYSQGVALLGEEFAVEHLSTANTLFVMVYCLGGVIGPSVGGVLMDAWPGYGLQALVSGAAFLLLGGLAVGPWRRRTAPQAMD
jgi:MFS family permease